MLLLLSNLGFGGSSAVATTPVGQDIFGYSNDSYRYLLNEGYTGGLSTARRYFVGQGSTGSGDDYDDIQALGYDKGLATARADYLKDNI
jgi:hypothetical protein